SRNRPLGPLRTLARLAQGWVGHPCSMRRMQLTSTGTPAQVVDSPCWVTRWANRKSSSRSHRSLLYEGAQPVVPQLIERDSVHSAVPGRDGRPFSRSPNPVMNTKGEAFRRQTTMSNGLWAALVDEPMAQLHGCANWLLTSRGSA